MICSEAFYPLAKAEAEAKGFPDLAIILVPHPLGSVPADQAVEYGRSVAESAVAALTEQTAAKAAAAAKETEEIAVDYDEQNPLAFFDLVNDYYYEQKWTDGLPVVPPTPERVRRMLEKTLLQPHEVLGSFAPSYAAASIEKIAVNAVMAGCKPEYFPVLIAAVKAALDPRFNLYAIQATTNPVTPMIVVNGPIVRELGMASKANVFGQGNIANVTIGRALRLCMVNIGGALPGQLDRATQGQPGKISFCIAENEEGNPWESYHVEQGYSKDQSTVTIFGVAGTLNILEQTSTTGQNLLSMIAGSMTPLGTNNLTIGGEVLLVMSPEHAQLMKRSGFSKNDVKKFLYDNARVPLHAIPEETKVKQLFKRRPKWFEHVPEHYAVPVVDYMEDIKILVSGGDGAHTTFMPSFGPSSRAVTVPVE